ncbi:MAG: hypothetical protein N3D84_02450 [Candidatus Woesearchaeota archaeon]|nr:hypothetical protein [Candidatus Woesearchaeota archaeon]
MAIEDKLSANDTDEGLSANEGCFEKKFLDRLKRCKTPEGIARLALQYDIYTATKQNPIDAIRTQIGVALDFLTNRDIKKKWNGNYDIRELQKIVYALGEISNYLIKCNKLPPFSELKTYYDELYNRHNY